MNRKHPLLAIVLVLISLSPKGFSQTLDASLTVGTFTVAEAVDATNGLLHVVNQGSNTVSTINLVTSSVVHTTNVGSSPAAVAVSASGLVYVANSNSVTVIKPLNNYSMITLGGVVNPYAIALNPVNGKIYVASYAKAPNNKILIISPASGNAETYVYSSYGLAWEIAVDSSSGRVYVGTNANCSSCSGVMTVIDPNTNAAQSVTVGRENFGIAESLYRDSLRHKLS